MAYFRECPAELLKNEDFIDIFFNFANTYTEDSIRLGIIQKQEKAEKEKSKNKDYFRGLGYSEEDIFFMGVEDG